MMSSADRLMYMASQIARNFETMGADGAARATADHIASFWDPRMKAQAFARLGEADNGLSPIAAQALAVLRDRGAPVSQTKATEFNAVNESGHDDAG